MLPILWQLFFDLYFEFEWRQTTHSMNSNLSIAYPNSIKREINCVQVHVRAVKFYYIVNRIRYDDVDSYPQKKIIIIQF